MDKIRSSAQSSTQTSFTELSTDRLRLRRFADTDLAALLAIRNDPEVARFQSWQATDEATLQSFLTEMARVELGTPGRWFQFAIVLRATGEFVGDCGFHLLLEDARQGEIGYTFSRAHQGKGLAQEAVSAMLTYIFATLDIHRIAAVTDVRNHRSIKLLERLSFRREGHTRQAFWNRGEWVDEYIYAMLRDRWLTRGHLTTHTKSANRTKTQVVLLGTGTPNPEPERHGSALAVVVESKDARQGTSGQAYLVDAGPGVVRRAADAAQRGIDALQMPRLTRLFLTHHHSDHTAGLPDLIFSPWVLERSQPLVVYGPRGTKAMVDHLLAAYTEDIRERLEGLEPSNDQGYRVEVHEYEAGPIYGDELVQVEAFRVQHGSWPAFGLRFTTADRTVVISGDTRPFDGLAEHYRGCDLLVHEVYSVAGLQRRPPQWQRYHTAVHTSTHELAKLANVARPGLIVLVHQLFWGVTEEALVAEIQEQYDGPVVSGHDLDVF